MTFTKEWLQKAISDIETMRDEIPFGLDEDGNNTLQALKMALAGMEAVHKDKAPELSQVIYHFRDWNEGFPVERFKADYVISWMLANYPPAPQPLTTSERAELENYRNAQQVVPEAISTRQAMAKLEAHEPCDSINVAYKYGWNACRAAMLQGGKS